MRVSAVLVTRGDVDLGPILETLYEVDAIDEVRTWNNAVHEDLAVWGRHEMLARCSNRVIYSQDDDILHTPEAINRILDAYRPGVLTGCMWAEWSDGAARQNIEGGYSDLAFPGSGSVYDREVPLVAAARYLEHFPEDDFFRLWCDAIIGVLAPTAQLDERFQELPQGDWPNRMANMPDAAALKRRAIMRARAVRDGTWDAHDVYLRDLQERLGRRR